MRRLALIAVLVAACGGGAAPAPTGPNDDLPPGAVVVYFRHGATDVRILHVGDCYLTETVNGGRWQLLNEGFFTDNPAVSCGPNAAPVNP